MSADTADNSVRAASVRNPLDGQRRIRAVLFDLDGTLYSQGPMRALMALELLMLPVTRPAIAMRGLRALSAYRRGQEVLRSAGVGNVRQVQLQRAVQQSGLPETRVQELVSEWMQRRPLKYLRYCRARGLEALLTFLAAQNVPIGVLSDYPAEDKLRSLGIHDRFSVVLCTTDPQIDALKPGARGFLAACEHWHLPPSDVLMVGDRADVDGLGARAAGMPCAIIGSDRPSTAESLLYFPNLERLQDALDDDR